MGFLKKGNGLNRKGRKERKENGSDDSH